MNITEKSFVLKEKIDLIKNINGVEIIEQYLLFKGEDSIGEIKAIPFKKLEDMALIHLGLTITPTNRLYVGTYLMRFYNHHGLVTNMSGKIKIPLKVWEEVKAINDKYRINP